MVEVALAAFNLAMDPPDHDIRVTVGEKPTAQAGQEQANDPA